MHKRIEGGAFTWEHFTRPSGADFAYIEKHFPLEECDERLVRHGSDVPRFHGHDGWFILVLHVPSLATMHTEFSRATLVMLCDKSTIYTLCDDELSGVAALMKQLGGKRVPKQFHHGTSMDIVAWLLDVVLDGVDDALAILSQAVLTAEAEVQRPPERMSRDLGTLQRDSLMLDVMIAPAQAAVLSLLHMHGLYRSERAERMLAQIGDRLHDAHHVLRQYQRMLESVFAQHAALMAQRTNRAMYVLAAVSVVCMPATLVASYYGMHVAGLPWAGDVRVVLLGLSIVLACALAAVVRLYQK